MHRSSPLPRIGVRRLQVAQLELHGALNVALVEGSNSLLVRRLDVVGRRHAGLVGVSLPRSCAAPPEVPHDRRQGVLGAPDGVRIVLLLKDFESLAGQRLRLGGATPYV